MTIIDQQIELLKKKFFVKNGELEVSTYIELEAFLKESIELAESEGFDDCMNFIIKLIEDVQSDGSKLDASKLLIELKRTMANTIVVLHEKGAESK